MIRKINAIISVLLILIILIHGIAGSTVLLGISYFSFKWLAWIGIFLLIIHIFIGIKFTINSIAISNSHIKNYFRKNILFWIRRITGFGLIVLIFFHLGIYGQVIDGTYVVFKFTTINMISQMLLIIFLFIHICSNINPLLISLGISNGFERKRKIFLILSSITLFLIMSILLYYISWL
ncbi:pilus assembly protein PilX [Methanobrevibacter arboriphilus]|nr:pilus assembly protein PilX [Methanobrevibacter arboriphilus]